MVSQKNDSTCGSCTKCCIRPHVVAIHFNVLVGKRLCVTTYKDEIESKKSGVAQSISSNSGYNGQLGFCESKIAIIFCYKSLHPKTLTQCLLF